MFLYVCFFLHLSFQDLFIFAEYESLTAVLVATKLWGNYLFWGMTPSAKTAQLVSSRCDNATGEMGKGRVNAEFRLGVVLLI